MTNENHEKKKANPEPAGSEAGELNDNELESVAGGIIVFGRRTAPVPDDGRGIGGIPVPNDGRGIISGPVPDDSRVITGEPVPNDGKS